MNTGTALAVMSVVLLLMACVALVVMFVLQHATRPGTGRRPPADSTVDMLAGAGFALLIGSGVLFVSVGFLNGPC